MSTVKTSNLQNASATNPNIVLNSDGTIGGDCLTQTCRAWVNFDGTGTVAIRASYNVSSITDNGTGDYTVNFTTALADANYATTGLAKEFDATTNTTVNLYYAKQTIANTVASGSVRVNSLAGANGGVVDCVVVSVAIFR